MKISKGEKLVFTIILILLLELAMINISYNLGKQYALLKIGKMMCNGVDGYLYIKKFENYEQLILRCYYLTPTSIEVRETILGWLK